MNVIKMILITCLLIGAGYLPVQVYAQDKAYAQIHAQKLIRTPLVESNALTRLFFSSQDKIYVLEWDELSKKNKDATLYTLSLTSEEWITQKVVMPNHLKNHALINFGVLADTLYLLSDHSPQVPHRFAWDTQKWKLTDTLLQLPFTAWKILGHDNRLMFTDNYNYHPQNNSRRTKIVSFTAHQSLMDTLTFMDEGIAYTHFTNEWFCSIGTYFAACKGIGYEIILYDSKLKSVHTLSKDIEPQNQVKVIPFVTALDQIAAKDLIVKLHQLDSQIVRIERILPLNDSLLIVSSIYPGDYYTQRRIDIWNVNTKQQILNQAIMPFEYPGKFGLFYKPENYPESFAFSRPIFSYQGKLYFLTTLQAIPQTATDEESFYKKNFAAKKISLLVADLIYGTHP